MEDYITCYMFIYAVGIQSMQKRLWEKRSHIARPPLSAWESIKTVCFLSLSSFIVLLFHSCKPCIYKSKDHRLPAAYLWLSRCKAKSAFYCPIWPRYILCPVEHMHIRLTVMLASPAHMNSLQLQKWRGKNQSGVMEFPWICFCLKVLVQRCFLSWK